MSITRFNKNGTVSIIGLTRTQYNAIMAILFGAERAFSYDRPTDEFRSNGDFRCTLTPEEKQSMDVKRWTL